MKKNGFGSRRKSQTCKPRVFLCVCGGGGGDRYLQKSKYLIFLTPSPLQKIAIQYFDTKIIDHGKPMQA